MKVMDEKNRNRIISDAKKFGGIGLRTQKLRIHNNGAKFPISKVYIDDKVITDEILYTLVLIPEVKISSKSGVILSYFRRKVGPIVFYAYPENIFTEKEKELYLERKKMNRIRQMENENKENSRYKVAALVGGISGLMLWAFMDGK